MSAEGVRPRARRRTLVLGSLAVGLVSFIAAIHWDIGAFVLLTALALSAGIFFAVPIVCCAACGREGIQFGRGNVTCPFCTAPHTEPAGTFLMVFKDRRRLVIEIPLALGLLFFSARLLCVPILALHILFAMFAPAARRSRWMNATAIAFLILISLPVDVELGGFHGSHWGVPRKGPRLVKLVMGMPRTRYCVERYGEFISGGCLVGGNEPEWLFVWEGAGVRPETPAAAKK